MFSWPGGLFDIVQILGDAELGVEFGPAQHELVGAVRLQREHVVRPAIDNLLEPGELRLLGLEQIGVKLLELLELDLVLAAERLCLGEGLDEGEALGGFLAARRGLLNVGGDVALGRAELGELGLDDIQLVLPLHPV